MITGEEKLLKIALELVSRGDLRLSGRISSFLEKWARDDRTDTDQLLDQSLQEERKDEPPIEVVDVDSEDEGEDSSSEEEPKDKEGFFPVSALPIKERRKGPNPKDVGVAKPDWWNP